MGEPAAAKPRWISDVPNSDVLRFATWIALVGAVSVASTVVVIREAEARAPRDLTDDYLVRWAIVSACSLLVLALFGGLAVFGRRTRFEIAGVWPLVAGIVVGCGYLFTLVAMGQTEPGSVSCDGPQSCETEFGFGAALLTVVAAVAIGVVFIAAFGLKRLAGRLLLGGD
jgi:hypothetical protein